MHQLGTIIFGLLVCVEPLTLLSGKVARVCTLPHLITSIPYFGYPAQSSRVRKLHCGQTTLLGSRKEQKLPWEREGVEKGEGREEREGVGRGEGRGESAEQKELSKARPSMDLNAFARAPISWTDLNVPPEQLRPDLTLAMGQCFNWKKLSLSANVNDAVSPTKDSGPGTPTKEIEKDSNESLWIGVIGEWAMAVKQTSNSTHIAVLNDHSLSSTSYAVAMMYDYFQLEEDLEKLYHEWAQVLSFPFLSSPLQYTGLVTNALFLSPLRTGLSENAGCDKSFAWGASGSARAIRVSGASMPSLPFPSLPFYCVHLF